MNDRPEAAITYLAGDATHPIGHGLKIIAHVCNNRGRWGRGFVLAISHRWPVARQRYLEMYRPGLPIPLGTVQFVPVESDITIAHMVAQDGLRSRQNPAPLRPSSLAICLEKVSTAAFQCQASVHMPRIGCGLAGGKWAEVEPLICRTLCAQRVPVFVYDWSASPWGIGI